MTCSPSPYWYPCAKDADERLDYQFDWSDFLDTDTIAASIWTVQAGLTVTNQNNTTTTATIWIEGGNTGSSYSLENKITTTAGRIAVRTAKISIRER